MNWAFLVPSLAELAVTILSGVASVAITVGVGYFTKKTGVVIETSKRDAIHKAIVNGINLAVSRGASLLPADMSTPKAKNFIVQTALEYVGKRMPGYIADFKLTDKDVEDMILANIPRVLGSSIPQASPPVADKS